MKKIRGFLVKRKVFSLFRYVRCKSHSSATTYRRLNPSRKSLSRFIRWGSKLKSKARAICSKNPSFRFSFRSGYLRVRDDPLVEEVPKGKMAVYVGQEDGDYERVLVPVIYINHPLFGQLLRKAEDEYGHDHPGGITIPCRVSEFENVKTRIAGAVCSGRKMMPWKRGV